MLCYSVLRTSTWKGDWVETSLFSNLQSELELLILPICRQILEPRGMPRGAVNARYGYEGCLTAC